MSAVQGYRLRGDAPEFLGCDGAAQMTYQMSQDAAQRHFRNHAYTHPTPTNPWPPLFGVAQQFHYPQDDFSLNPGAAPFDPRPSLQTFPAYHSLLHEATPSCPQLRVENNHQASPLRITPPLEAAPGLFSANNARHSFPNDLEPHSSWPTSSRILPESAQQNPPPLPAFPPDSATESDKTNGSLPLRPSQNEAERSALPNSSAPVAEVAPPYSLQPLHPEDLLVAFAADHSCDHNAIMGQQEPLTAMDKAAIADTALALQMNSESEAALAVYTALEPEPAPESIPDAQRGYAKVVFPDGDYIFTTTTVIFGRNVHRNRQLRQARQRAQEAREALDTYRKEQSHPSQAEDGDLPGDLSDSGQSLEGRPAPPSNFSEQGGPVWYHTQSDVDITSRRPKSRRRISHLSKSSSTGSVAPANLYVGQHFDPTNSRSVAFVPVHTSVPEHITKISKHHLRFQYNFEKEYWELHVMGNRAFVNEILFEKGTVVPLQHNDEIIIATLSMTFKLPDHGGLRGRSRGTSPSIGTFDDDRTSQELSDDDSVRGPSTSPPRRLSNSMQSSESESEGSEDSESAAKPSTSKVKRPKLKLKARSEGKQKPNSPKLKRKGDAQKSLKRESSSEEPAPVTSKKAQKQPEKTSKTGGKTVPGTGEAIDNLATASTQAAGDADGPMIEPPRRSGPGRPPKDGNVSKRDKSLAQKLQKEYEKRGEKIPDFAEAVDIVRKEQKEKAQRAKAIQNGEIEEGQEIRPSIETDFNEAGPSTFANDASPNGESGSNAKRSSPKARRQIRAMSPVKPKEECTEEDLKKPEGTYLNFLDTILSEHPSGVADLQEIYELFMKKWPFFKYGQDSQGWQSSIRHNLLQNRRFKQAGRSGKGKLWSIDHTVPMERERRRKSPQAQRSQGVNGQHSARNTQHAQYGQGYGQPTQNGQPSMGPGGYYPQYPHGGYPPHGHAPYGQQWQPQPAPLPKPPVPVQDPLVNDILTFNYNLALRWNHNPAESARQSAIAGKVVEFLSECDIKNLPSEEMFNSIKASEAHGIFAEMADIFKRHRPNGVFILDPFQPRPVDQQPWTEYKRDFPQPGPSQPQDTSIQQDPQVAPSTTPGAAPNAAAGNGVSITPSAKSAPAVNGAQTHQEAVVKGEQTSPEILASPQALHTDHGAGLKRSAEDDGNESGPEAKRARAD